MLRQSPSEDNRLDLVLITPTGKISRYSTSATRAEVIRQARLFRLAVADPDDDQGYPALARQMYGWLLAPLEPELQQQGITSLVYSLDAGLRTVPLAAMMRGSEFLIARYTLAIIPSVGLLDARSARFRRQTLLATGADRFQHLEPLPAVALELNLIRAQRPDSQRLFNEELHASQSPGAQGPAKSNDSAFGYPC